MGRNSPQEPDGGAVSPPPQKFKPAMMEKGPGPAAYFLKGTTGQRIHCPSKKQSPAYSFGSRTKGFHSYTHTSTSPGPIYYITPNMTRKGKDGTPVYTLHSRTKQLQSSCSPGPAAYNTSNVKPLRTKNPPAYSFGSRTSAFSKRTMNPAPNAYTLPSLTGGVIVGKKTNPAYSMTSRTAVGGPNEDLSNTPGPGAYKAVHLDVYTKKSPVYTLHNRDPTPSSNMCVPGPGAHSPEKVTATLRNAPKYTFGIRHSEFIAPCHVRGKDIY